jgi:hypothetical protein
MAIRAADDGITPVEAALETSLTVDEAEEILNRFADRGHLVVHRPARRPPLHAAGERSGPEPGAV